MSFLSKFLVISTILGIALSGAGAFAQEAAVSLDENVTPADLGVEDPRILPGNPFYFLKNAVRGVESFFTFDEIKKAELRQKFADQKLIELKKLTETKPGETKALDEAFENYQAELNLLQGAVAGIIDKPAADEFMDKFIDHNFRHQKYFGLLEKELPEMAERIRERNMDVLSSAAGLVSPEALKGKIVKITEEQSGSDFKHFKNLEILEALEEKLPEQAKEAIRSAQENSLKRLHEDLELMSPEDREKFQDYVENIGGNEIQHLKTVQKLEAEEISKNVREQVEAAKEMAFSKINDKTEADREELLDQLKQGKIENLRIINELEVNLSSEAKEKILEMKHEVEKKIKEIIEATDDPEKQEKLLTELKDFHDVKQLGILEEMGKVVSSNGEEFLERAREQIRVEIEKDVDGANNEEQLRLKFDKLSGDMPNHITIINNLRVSEEITEGLLEGQAAKLGRVVANIKDLPKLEELKQRIENAAVEVDLRKYRPDIFQEIDDQENNLLEGMSEEDAARQIQKAEEKIIAVEEEFSALDEDRKADIAERSSYRVLLANAQKKLEEAKNAYEEGSYGNAFGMANAAFHNADNVLMIIKKMLLNVDFFQDEEIENRFFEEGIMLKERLEERFRVQFPTGTIPLPGEVKLRFIAPEEDAVSGEKPTICIAIYDPVCGKDGKTYSNKCQAGVAGVEIEHEGPCKGLAPVDATRLIQPSTGSVTVGLANPAAVYCQKLGYQYITKTDAAGAQRGICILSNTDICDDWEFYNGECGVEYRKDNIIGTPSLEVEKREETFGDILPVEDVGF